MSSSKIFLQNRALGYVSNEIPLVTRYINLRRENLIITCVGRAFHTYSSDRFQLLSVSPQHETDITCLAADSYLVYTSCGNQIYAWRRGIELKHTYTGHKAAIKLLFPFAANLVSIDESGALKIWDVKTESIYKEIQLDFTATAICHPPTYTNKLLIGSAEGKLQLWNIKTGTMIHEFKGWNSCVTSLEPAPAEDMMAIGLSNGKIILHNLKFDVTNISFTQDWGSVTRISFLIKRQLMITGSPKGTVVVWNLEEGKVDSLIIKAHHGPVCGLQCLPDEPLLVTSSSDNSLKMWRFDMSDGSASLFKIREGHFKPPVSIRFHGVDGASILSSGNDSSLRVFNTITEIANKSFGRASYNRKASKKKGNKWADPLIMPPISTFTSETTRDKEWDSIVAVHRGIPTVTTWSFDKSKMGEHKLCHERFKKNVSGQKGISATCACLTHCGNFAVIGYSSGHIDKYNIQSGLHRGSYGEPIAHKYVRGVYVDTLNQIMVSGGSDTFLQFWNFKKLNLLSKLDLEDTVSLFSWHTESSFLAVALDNYDICLVDIDTRTIVRKFTGHRGPLTDLTFSPDSRWLVSSAMDSTIRTWDIPSSSMIDILKVDTPCVSLTFSPTGSYLATAHADRLGIYLWFNKTLYNHVSLRPITEEDQITESLPLTGINQESLECPIDEDTDEYISKVQIENTITMSGLNDARWQSILNLDAVKKRNKPLQPPKAPAAAPFFLPTIQSLDFQFDLKGVDKNDSNTKVIPETLMQTVFAQQLLKASSLNDYQVLFDQLKLMGPSALNYEVRSLSPEAGGTYELMVKFLELLKQISTNNKDFELSQSYLGVFLKYNGRALAQRPEAINSIEQLSKHNAWEQLQNNFLLCLSIVEYMKNN
uniref:WD repeat-containing protein 36 n=1 Tax=Schizaphis graminum TaxID=13262 RepID=A0A2S2PSE4_SCHGA